jgi:four helix bundle protein
VVAEEADESVYWLELITEANLLPKTKVRDLLNEANELTAIFTSARRTSTGNQTSKIKPQT